MHKRHCQSVHQSKLYFWNFNFVCTNLHQSNMAAKVTQATRDPFPPKNVFFGWIYTFPSWSCLGLTTLLDVQVQVASNCLVFGDLFQATRCRGCRRLCVFCEGNMSRPPWTEVQRTNWLENCRIRYIHYSLGTLTATILQLMLHWENCRIFSVTSNCFDWNVSNRPGKRTA